MKRLITAICLLVTAALFIGCGGSEPTDGQSSDAGDVATDASPDVTEPVDGGTPSDSGLESPDTDTDTTTDTDADAANHSDATTPPDPDPARPDRVTVRLRDGQFAAGEIVAVYDRTRWWNPGPGGLVYAIFDPSRYAGGDADRSFTFVASDEVDEIVSMEPVETSYAEFLAEKGFDFVRSPFERPAYVVMGNDGYHLDEDGYGDFAFDLQITDEQGRRFTGDGSQNSDHFVWDETAFAPIGGPIFETFDEQIDNPPGSYPDGAPNNLVGIRLGGNFYAYLLHFRQDGVEPDLSAGDVVQPGDRLGRIGNSGVTLEPHLHLVLLWFDPVLDRSYSVPVHFEQIEVAPTPIGPWRTISGAIPDTGVWIR